MENAAFARGICEQLLLLTTYPVAHCRDLQTKNQVVDLQQLVFLNENYLQSLQIKKLKSATQKDLH